MTLLANIEAEGLTRVHAVWLHPARGTAHLPLPSCTEVHAARAWHTLEDEAAANALVCICDGLERAGLVSGAVKRAVELAVAL